MRFGNLGGKFGAGNYFAINASYSTNGYQHKEAAGKNKGQLGLFYASVLIGTATTKQPDAGRNKPVMMIDGTKRYDSVTDGKSMYVVYSNP